MAEKIEFTCFLYNKKLQDDLGIDLGDANDVEAKVMCTVQSIINVSEAAKADGEIYIDRARIEQAGGEAFLVAGTYQQVVQRLHEKGW